MTPLHLACLPTLLLVAVAILVVIIVFGVVGVDVGVRHCCGQALRNGQLRMMASACSTLQPTCPAPLWSAEPCGLSWFTGMTTGMKRHWNLGWELDKLLPSGARHGGQAGCDRAGSESHRAL